MTYFDEIKSKLDAESGELEIIMAESMSLLAKAISENEIIPLDFTITLINQANQVSGYGGIIDESKIIMSTLKRFRDETISIDKDVYRFLAIALSSLFAMLETDVSRKTNNSSSLMYIFSDKNTQKKSEIIEIMLDEIRKYIVPDIFSNWYFEFLTYVLIYISYLRELSGDETVKADLLRDLVISHNNLKETEIKSFNDWKSNWLDRHDYFRMTYLLLEGNFAAEERLLSIIKTIVQ